MGGLLNLFAGGWSSVVTTFLTTIASAISTGVKDIASSVQQGITATTTPHLRGSPWFGTLFHSVAGPAFVVAMIVLLCAIADAVLHGQPGEALKRAFVAPLLVAIAMLAATTIGGAAVGVVNSMSGAILSSALSGRHAGTDAITVLAVAAVGTAVVPILGIALGGIALVAVIALWVELAVRGVLIYLVFALVPLSLAGVFWAKTQSWTKRTIEIIVALLLSQLVIYTFLAIGVDALSALHAGWSATPLALGALSMSAFGLPIALRIAPHTVAAAEHFGKAIGHIKQAGTMAAGAATGGAGLAASAGAGAGAGAGGIGGVGATGGGVVEGAGVLASSLGSRLGASATSPSPSAGSSSGGIPSSTSPGPLQGASGTGTADVPPVPTGNGQVAGGSPVSDLTPVGASGPTDGAPGATDTPPGDPGTMPPPPADEIAAPAATSNPLTRERPLPAPVQAALAARRHVGQAARAGVVAAAKTGHVPSGVAVGAVHLVKPPKKGSSEPGSSPASPPTPPGDVHLTNPKPPPSPPSPPAKPDPIATLYAAFDAASSPPPPNHEGA